MKGFIHSFESFGTVDGPGIRFVVFTQGCPLRCQYCHNPDTWGRQGEEYDVETVAKKALKYKSYFADRGGVTVSGGEPLLQLDFLIELFTLLKQNGVRTAVDTSGACFDSSDPIQAEKYEKLLSVCDLFLLDIKHIDSEKHRALTGKGNENILAFAKYLSEKGKAIWIRHVLVPGITDVDADLEKLRLFLDELKTVEKVEVLPYHTLGEAKYERLGIPYPLKGVKPPEKERIENAKRILRRERQ